MPGALLPGLSTARAASSGTRGNTNRPPSQAASSTTQTSTQATTSVPATGPGNTGWPAARTGSCQRADVPLANREHRSRSQRSGGESLKPRIDASHDAWECSRDPTQLWHPSLLKIDLAPTAPGSEYIDLLGPL